MRYWSTPALSMRAIIYSFAGVAAFFAVCEAASTLSDPSRLFPGSSTIYRPPAEIAAMSVDSYFDETTHGCRPPVDIAVGSTDSQSSRAMGSSALRIRSAPSDPKALAIFLADDKLRELVVWVALDFADGINGNITPRATTYFIALPGPEDASKQFLARFRDHQPPLYLAPRPKDLKDSLLISVDRIAYASDTDLDVWISRYPPHQCVWGERLRCVLEDGKWRYTAGPVWEALTVDE